MGWHHALVIPRSLNPMPAHLPYGAQICPHFESLKAKNTMTNLKVPLEVFLSAEAAMTSEDGQTFLMRVKCEDGSDLMLGFPHQEIANIIELAAMQLNHRRDDAGRELTAAFNTSSLELTKNEEGQTVLTLAVGKTGNISFILAGNLERELFDALGRSMVRH